MAIMESFQKSRIRGIWFCSTSASVIGNPMGFARNVGLDIRDFLSIPAKGNLQVLNIIDSSYHLLNAMKDTSFHSRLAALRLDLDEEMIVSFFDFIRTVISRLQSGALSCPDSTLPIVYENHSSSPSLPLVFSIGAPWQQIYFLSKKAEEIYVEVFVLALIKLTLR
ncbi:hypothetical protein HHK36_001979 [Tetracentron sinense]|uniref:Uncharacterized protein n=1 Tax=Tetracentron sinense TaxID=13715 RepID=A0A834ZV06_TETSI|nr:hypothetical protein HHK36_001979 [Tetracentron sinense]